MISQIDIEKTLQLQPNKECLFVSVATVLNHVVDVVNELQKNATISKIEKVETPAENVQPDYVITYMSDGHIKKFYGHDSIVELEVPLPQGTRITIKSITKGGDNDRQES